MSEQNKNTITYDDNWKSVTQTEYPVVCAPDSEESNVIKSEKKKDNSPKQLLITIQLIVCIIIALAAFILKGIGGDVYAAARDWYYTNLNDSAIFENSDELGLDGIFGTATKDEV
ncbi:MAG: hypothetical protein UHD05_06100 [Ruminococcus sp.]|nr:hypothetical protein [Ruminococcus sp.]